MLDTTLLPHSRYQDAVIKDAFLKLCSDLDRIYPYVNLACVSMYRDKKKAYAYVFTRVRADMYTCGRYMLTCTESIALNQSS